MFAQLSLTAFDLILIAGLALCAAGALLALLFFLQDFQQELRYINMEIQRSTGKEREHWQKKKRQLLLSLLPFTKK